jgi:glycosyltransferase involved in cell wall biosynthesis
VIRVAVVIEALGRGGAERLLVETARAIDSSRFELRVYTLFSARRDYEARLRELGVVETCLALRGLADIPLGAWRLRSLLRAARSHVVHTHLFAANVVGRLAARMAGLPVLSTIHAADYEPVARLGNPGLTRSKQILLQAADALSVVMSRVHLVAVSRYVAESAVRRLAVPSHRVEVIPNAIDVALFRPDGDRRDTVRASLALDRDIPVLVCVGRLTPQKGQDILIRALAESRNVRPNCHLLLVGDGPSRAQLQALAERCGVETQVSFLGPRWDVPDVLRASDVLILPSLHEGFGLVLVEALASGIPVVASRTGPASEIVREGETGFLFTPGDPVGLARALACLLADPERRHEMGRRGRQDAVERFALPTMVRRIEALYERTHADADARRRRQ